MAEPQNTTAEPSLPMEPERESRDTSAPPLRRASSPSEDGEMSEEPEQTHDGDAPPLPDEAPPLPDEAPPLPDEPLPAATEEDDGWSAQLDVASGCWYFLNRFTGLSQWENPRVPSAVVSSGAPGTEPYTRAPGTEEHVAPPPSPPREPYLGYNPKIHGDFDPNADYAKWHQPQQEEPTTQDANPGDPLAQHEQVGTFNRFTGAFQGGDKNAAHHNDENKSKRQMHAFFDVDRAANAHEGRSLKAERANQRLSKKQVKAFNEQRRAKKEQKRRDFLMS